jgi:hypothetical protein
MQKIFIVILSFMMTLYLSISSLHASSHYQGFEYLELASGKLLDDYTDKEYQEYYKEVNRRKFFGWRVHRVHQNIRVSYIKETLFSYYNDGFTAIDYEYKLDLKTSQKMSISSTGTIGIKHLKDQKVFRHNLDASLKLSADYHFNKEEHETIQISLKIDPGTQVDLYIYGEGKISNGVAAHYTFFIRTNRGGYEVFIVTTQYQRLEKKPI